jgi:hypothetical protein
MIRTAFASVRLLVLALSWGSFASAEPSEDVQQRARESFTTGIAAFDRQDFEAARRAFLETLALRPEEPVVRRNLALAEIYSGHYLDGARRLTRVLHGGQITDAASRARMLESLRLAETQLERITLELNVSGAQVQVDAESLGESPVPFAWYVAPGPYRVRIEKEGYEPLEQSRMAVAGATPHLRLELVPVKKPEPSEAVDEPAARRGPEPWVLIGGGALTLAGVTAGLLFRGSAADATDKADAQERRILAQQPAGCGTNPSGTLVAPCKELRRWLTRHDDLGNAMWTSLGVGAVAGIATLVYWGVSASQQAAGADSAATEPAWYWASPSEGYGVGVGARF